jgi:hypothetical protein
VLRKASIYLSYYKNFFPYIKTKTGLEEMKKNSGDIFESIEVDPISGEYYITIPEQIMNELSWYEDTEISFKIEGDEVVLTEREVD